MGWAGRREQLANSPPESHRKWRQDVSPGRGFWASPLNRLSLVPNPHFTGKWRLREREEPNDQGQSRVWNASSVCPSCLSRTPGRKAPRAHTRRQKPGRDWVMGSRGPAASFFPWLLPFPRRDGTWLVFPAPKDQEGALLSQRCRV